MTTYSVSSASQLTSTLSLAQGGDVITLAAGNYGDVWLSAKFASDVTITSEIPGLAVFHSLTFSSSSHLDFENVSVAATPVATTNSWTPAVAINDSSFITFAHSTITGGNAVGASGDSIVGLPTGYGVSLINSNNVKIDADNISQFYKGVVLYKSDYVTISNSDVHDTRTTPIVAAGGNHITIDSNHIHDVNPYNFGPNGDHADYLALWTNDGQTAASTDIKITNNLMEQGKGQAVLGMWLQGGSAGYTNVVVSGNAILAGNSQGITLSDVTGGVVDHNVLLQTSGTNSESAPRILLATGSEIISVHDNFASAINDTSGSTGALANILSDNHLVQMWKASAAGYYSSALVTLIDQVTSYSSIYSLASANLPGVGASPAAGETLTGTAANDVLTSTNAAGGTTIYGGAGNDTLTGGSTVSLLRGEDGNDYIVTKHGFADVNGNAGNDTIVGGDGNDWLVGGRDNDMIYGGGGDQILYGNMGNDILIGGGGSETLRGGQGDDSMSGGAGNDWMSGDLGNDTISGGAGADTFHTFAGAGVDWILDFNSAEGDRVAIDPGTTYTLRFDGYNMIVDMGSDRLVLAGVTPATIGTWLAP